MTAVGPVAITAAEIDARVRAIASAINDRYSDGVILLPVLPEANRFCDALCARLHRSAEVDPIEITAYSRSSAPRAQLRRERSVALADRDLMVVAAVVDTGIRLCFAVRELARERPRSVTICALLDRPERRLIETLPLAYVGFRVPDTLFAGYGLGRTPAHAALADVHHLDPASAERARRRRLVIA